MHSLTSLILVVFISGGVGAPVASAGQTPGSLTRRAELPVDRHGRRFQSPDGRVSAIVLPTGKSGGESRIEIRNADGVVICEKDFGSRDGEHGKGLVQAGWTADSKFFVWGMEITGGHSPWHCPTYFFDRKLKKIRSLDDFVGAITTEGFTLKAPDLVSGRRLAGENLGSAPFSVHLSRLRK